MSDERMQSVLEEWFEARDAAPDDVRRSARHVAERRPQVHQRSRWWPFPVLYRKPQSPTTNDTTEYQPTPTPALNGRTPTVTGRTQSMFSPVKAITAGALIFALGGVLLIAQPFDQQGSSVPGAESGAAMAPAWVTGTIVLGSCSNPTNESVGTDPVQRERGWRCEGQTWDASDDRLDGEGVSTWDADVYDLEEGPVSVRVGGYEIRNGSGGWSCRHSGVAQGAGLQVKPESGETLVCVGDGGFDDLAAVFELDWSSRRPVTFQGVIFPGSLPSAPSE